MAVVQFTPSADPTKVAEGFTIARGVELTTRAVREVTCRFRTGYPTTLWPIAVDSAALEPDRVVIEGKPKASTALLRLTLRCTAAGNWPSLTKLESLRFYLDGGEPTPSSLYECLFNTLCEVWVRGETAKGEKKTVVLPATAVRPLGFGADEELMPSPACSFPGYVLLQEFFAFPQKYLFFDRPGLDKLAKQGFHGPVEVLFFLRGSPRVDVVVRADNFKLGCAPVVNLFEMAAEPIALNQLQTEYWVVPKYGETHAHEVYSVDRVMTSGSYLEGPVELLPFYALRPSQAQGRGRRGERGEAYWFTHRRPSPRDGEDGTEVALSFTDPNFRPTSPAVETITAHLTCTNRDLPPRLPFGGDNADFRLESDAPVGRVRLLTRPTRPLRPPLGRAAQWPLISQLGLNHISLLESGRGPEALQTLLALFDFSGSAATRKMVQGGIVGVSSRRIAGRTGNRLGNTVSLGVEVNVRFDEDAFTGAGAFLLASVLDRFLGAYVTINSFTQMVAVSKQREGTWKRWPPRCGDRTLL